MENVEISLNQDESQQNQITHYGLVEEINLKQSDISNTLENIMIDGMTSDNEKYLLKKYKANNKLPMILVSVSVNLSSRDFMKLIETTFTKLNYRNICNIKK